MTLYFVIGVYILFVGAVTSLIHNEKNRKTTAILLTLLPLLILSMFRNYNIGNDTATYLNLFNSLQWKTIGEYSIQDSRFEIGYLVLNKLIHFFTDDKQAILIVTSIMIYGVFAIFTYRYSKLPWLSVFIFFMGGYFSASMNTIRLYLALIITMCSYPFIKKRKIIPFIGIVTLAFLFHRSAIVFLLAYLLYNFHLNYKTILISVVLSIAAFVLFTPLLNNLFKFFTIYQYYLGSDYLDGEIRIASVFNLLLMLAIFIFSYVLYKRKLEEENVDDRLMLNFILVSCVITFLSFQFNLLDKAGTYFSVYSIILLPNILFKIKNKNIAAIILLSIIILFSCYFFVIQIYRPEWNYIYPYQFC